MGRKPAEHHAGYPEIKRRADGSTYTVYVMPYWAPSWAETQAVLKKRKVQSAPYDPSDGKEFARAISEAISRAAQKKREAEEECQRARAKTSIPAEPTLRDVLEEYESSSRHVERGRRASTRQKNRDHLANLGRYHPRLADAPLSRLTRSDIRLHLADYSRTHATSSADRYRGFLYTLGRFAEKESYWPKNLVPKASTKDVVVYAGSALVRPSPYQESKVLELRQVLALNLAAEAIGDVRMQAALRLLRLGLRAGEIVALDEEALDRFEDVITVRYRQTEDKPDWAGDRSAISYLDRSNTPAAWTRIHVHPHVMAEMRRSLETAGPTEIPAFDDRGKSVARRFVIPNRDGRMWRYPNFLRKLQQVYAKARVELRATEYDGDGDGKHAPWTDIWRNTYLADLFALDASNMELMELTRLRDLNVANRSYVAARRAMSRNFESYRVQVRSGDPFNVALTQIDLDMEHNRSPLLKNVDLTRAVIGDIKKETVFLYDDEEFIVPNVQQRPSSSLL